MDYIWISGVISIIPLELVDSYVAPIIKKKWHKKWMRFLLRLIADTVAYAVTFLITMWIFDWNPD